jgi:transposase
MGAPRYDQRRVNLIKRLAGTMPVDEVAKTIGVSRDGLRVWLMRHAAAHGIARNVKVYRRRGKSESLEQAALPAVEAQPGA